jgi:uncharacterized membrane protein YecN with MAPEG domain
MKLNQANATVLRALAGTLVFSRILHPIGIGRKSPNAFCAGGNILQSLVLLVLGVSGFALAMFSAVSHPGA